MYVTVVLHEKYKYSKDWESDSGKSWDGLHIWINFIYLSRDKYDYTH